MEKQDASILASVPTEHQVPDSSNLETPSKALEEARDPKEVESDHPVEEEYDYVTGFKLLAVTGCVTVVAFLIMLDQSIIATVGYALKPATP